MGDVQLSFKFKVEIDGISEAGFQTCSGLNASTDPVEYREGTDPNHVRKLPGLNKYEQIRLERGMTDSLTLWQWRQKVIDGKTERKSVSIVLYDPAEKEVQRWNLRKAWPSNWLGPTFNANASDIAIEALEFVYEELVKG